MEITPIGIFHTSSTYAYDVPRQGTLAGDNTGIISLTPGQNFQQALYQLDSFSHIWVLYIFHKNNQWKPMVMPPRHRNQKVGVFASRSPYRPNAIGMSCVRLLSIHNLDIHVQGHDLLDGTPVIDIKPYLPYADSFPQASPGWTSQGDNTAYAIDFTSRTAEQLTWLEIHGVPCIRAFILDRLSNTPLSHHQNRLLPDCSNCHVLAYRTWRILFTLAQNTITIQSIRSGYSAEELASPLDPYQDKQTHRLFLATWP